MREAVIVTSVRTPVGKASRGAFSTLRPDDLGAVAIRGALEQTPGLDPAEVEDVILGCSFPEAEQGMDVARNSALLAGLPESVAGVTVSRFCASGLQAIAFASHGIAAGMADVLVAGGTESTTRIPGGGNRFMPSPTLMRERPDVFLGMGLTAERVAERYGVSREDQDAFAAESHRRALAAQAEGRFDAELIPVQVTRIKPSEGAEPAVETFVHRADEGPRAGTTPEGLAALKPVFKKGGTVTAGNSSQNSDGAAASVFMSAERAATLGLEPLGRLVSFAVGGVDPGVMGIGPVVAIPKALKQAGLRLEDIDLIELNEAFASQSVYVLRHLALDPARVNVNGGAIALGHPLGCTGAKLTATLLHEMIRRRVRYGLVSMCIAGGMGAAGVFENLRP
ncbi:MAG: thiolase family protein [Deltaproteobacteria bacterium]|nr:thiolase family protein [Deltaproteobacteria bacterium]